MGDDAANKADFSASATALYAAYAFGMIASLVPEGTAMAAGSLAITVAIIAAYIFRGKAKGTLFESHFQWLVRTFWIGGGVYLPVLTLAGFGFLWSRFDMGDIQSQVENGQADDMMQLMQQAMEKNHTLLVVSGLIVTLPVALWWVWRCWRGYLLLKAKQPVPDVMRWL